MSHILPTTPTEITIGEADKYSQAVIDTIREQQREFGAADESTQREKKEGGNNNEQDLLNASQMQGGAMQHPLLNSQQLDGMNPDDADATPLANKSPEAQQKLQNQKRHQAQLRAQAQATHQQMISPHRGG